MVGGVPGLLPPSEQFVEFLKYPLKCASDRLLDFWVQVYPI